MNIVLIILAAVMIFSLCRWAYWGHRLAVARRDPDAFRRTRYVEQAERHAQMLEDAMRRGIAETDARNRHKVRITGIPADGVYRAKCTQCPWAGGPVVDRSKAVEAALEHGVVK